MSDGELKLVWPIITKRMKKEYWSFINYKLTTTSKYFTLSSLMMLQKKINDNDVTM